MLLCIWTKNHLTPAITYKKIDFQTNFRNPMTVFSSGEKKYVLPDKESRIFEVKLQLPQDLTCEQCILQWTYVTGNRYAKLLVQHFNTNGNCIQFS